MLHLIVLGLILVGAFLSYLLSSGFPLQSGSSSPITGLSLPGIGPSRSIEAVLAPDVIPGTVRREELAEGLAVLAGAAPAPADEPEAAGTSAAAQLPYLLYSVLEGDTASAIAVQFGVGLQYLLWANPDLRDGELLAVGQMLVVPSTNGILATIRFGETLSELAARFDITVEAIVAWPGNGITSADDVIEGEMVMLPGAVMPQPALPEPTVAPAPAAVPAPAPAPAPPPPPPAPVTVTSNGGLIWPAAGPISSYFDGSHPLGIDIDLYNNTGAAIAAATSGTVTFAGGSPCCSYGLYVIIMSPGGIETLYAHLSILAVSPGQAVSQGQSLGTAGCTGYCTGTHLHFEVIDNGVRVNPLNYLP